MKKKFLCGAAVMAMTASMLFGCAGDSAEETTAAGKETSAEAGAEKETEAKEDAEKKETEERLEKQRAEKQEQEERQYNLKIDGKDVADLTGKLVELLGTSTSTGVTENGVSTFDVLA